MRAPRRPGHGIRVFKGLQEKHVSLRCYPSALGNGDILAVHLREHRREGIAADPRVSSGSWKIGREGIGMSTAIGAGARREVDLARVSPAVVSAKVPTVCVLTLRPRSRARSA